MSELSLQFPRSTAAVNNPVFSYFLDAKALQKQGRKSCLSAEEIEEYKTNWLAIGSQDFPATDLVHLGHNVQKQLRHQRWIKGVPHCAAFVADNFQILERALYPKIGELTHSEAALTINTYSHFNTLPRRDFLNKFEHHLQKLIKNEPINEDQLWPLGEILSSYARLGLVPSSALLNVLLDATERRMDEYDNRDLVNTIWALAIFDMIKPDPQYEQMAINILRECAKREKEYTNSDMRRILHVHLHFGWPAEDFNLEPETNASSRDERFLHMLFNQSRGVAHLTNIAQSNSLLNHQYDMTLCINELGSEPLQIEVDGKSHFLHIFNEKSGTYESRAFNGKTRLQNDLIMRTTPAAHVLRYSFKFIDALYALPHASQQNFALITARHALRQEPGIYTAHMGMDGEPPYVLPVLNSNLF